MLATCMFHQYILALRVSAQQYWINFKAATHYRQLELNFFQQVTLETFIQHDFQYLVKMKV